MAAAGPQHKIALLYIVERESGPVHSWQAGCWPVLARTAALSLDTPDTELWRRLADSGFHTHNVFLDTSLGYYINRF